MQSDHEWVDEGCGDSVMTNVAWWPKAEMWCWDGMELYIEEYCEIYLELEKNETTYKKYSP
jgi:hypothetical protein